MPLTTQGSGQFAHILVMDSDGNVIATVLASKVEEVIAQLVASANRSNPTTNEGE